jgi:endonuclease YncB( thermonuclease family)
MTHPISLVNLTLVSISLHLILLVSINYFRLLAEVWVDGESLGESLIDAGYARPYAGGKKQGWCQ